MFQRLLSWIGFGQEDAPAPDERLDKMNSMTDTMGRMRRLIAQGTWKGRRGTWRTSKLESVHPNIFYLITTVRSTTDAILSRSSPPKDAKLSRRYTDNLYPVTLDQYLIDEQGKTCPPQTIMLELIQAVTDMVNNINMLDQTDPNQYDYYLRVCSNLFGELEIITKAYL